MSEVRLVVQGPEEGCIALNKTGAAVTASFRVVLLLPPTTHEEVAGTTTTATTPSTATHEVTYVLYRLRVKESSIRISRIYGLLYADPGEAVSHLVDTLSLIAEGKLVAEGKLAVVRVEYVTLSAHAGRLLRRHGEMEKSQCGVYFRSPEQGGAPGSEHGPVRLYHAHCTLTEPETRSVSATTAAGATRETREATSTSHIPTTTAASSSTAAQQTSRPAPVVTTTSSANTSSEPAKDDTVHNDPTCSPSLPTAEHISLHTKDWHGVWHVSKSKLLLAGVVSGATVLLFALRRSNYFTHLVPISWKTKT